MVAVIHELWTRQGAESSPMGIGLAIISTVLMLYLSKAKNGLVGRLAVKHLKQMDLAVLSVLYMAMIVLIGAALTALLGWWWIDSIISFGLTYFVVKEGIEAIQEARGVEDT